MFGGDQLKFADADSLSALQMPTPHPRQVVPKYSPDQPRVPAGNPDGGQWTNADGSQDVGAPYGTTPDGTPVDAAQSSDGERYRIDLLDEEARGGHTIREHIDKTPEELKDRVRQTIRDEAYSEEDQDIRSGSFPSLGAANKLVNATVEANRDTVAGIAAGVYKEQRVVTEFGSTTGIEAYARGPYSQPRLRDTTAVGVYVRRDPASPNGFTIISAYPRNID